MTETCSTRRRKVPVPLLVFAALGFVFLPLMAEGQRAAYFAFAIAFLVSTIVSAVIERRLHLSRRPAGNVGVGAIVGLGLIVTSLRLPILETTVLGAMSGFLVGASAMILLEMWSEGHRRGG